MDAGEAGSPAAKTSARLEEDYGKALRLVGRDEQELTKLRAALATLDSTPSGRKILSMVDADAERLGGRIRLSSGIHGNGSSGTIFAEGSVIAQARANPKEYTVDDTGRFTIVQPGTPISPDHITMFLNTTTRSEKGSAASLGHELLHAHYGMNGILLNAGEKTQDPTDPRKPGVAMEESRAIGRGAYENEPLSENAVRRELGLELRTSHADGNAD